MLKGLQRLFNRRKDNVIGIDIGTDSAKVAEISWRKGVPTLINAGMIPLPTHVVEDSRIVDPESMMEILRNLLSTSETSGKDAVVAVGGRTIFAREVIFPAMTREELREAVKWDMDKYVPYEAGSYYHDFAVVGRGKTELETKVLLVAAPLDTVNSIVSAVKEIGLIPLAVDIEPLALYRTLSSAENSMVIDMGGHVSQVTVFQQGSPAVTRTISLGGRRFTEVIMRVLDLDQSEAERLKQRQSGLLRRVDNSGEPTVLHRQLEMVVDELVREVRRTAEYYQMQNRDAVIDKIFFTGGGAKLDNLTQHVSTQLDIPVLRHNLPTNLDYAASLDKNYVESIFPQLAVAIGLAMRGGGE